MKVPPGTWNAFLTTLREEKLAKILKNVRSESEDTHEKSIIPQTFAAKIGSGHLG